MRSFDELIQTQDLAWLLIQGWFGGATNSVGVLPHTLEKVQEELSKTQVTIRSFMGAVVYETDGILIDDGWLRILGSGSTKLLRGLGSRNLSRTQSESAGPVPYYLFADDVAGGYFMINGRGLNGKVGNAFHLPPDTLEQEDCGKGYGDFLNWVLSGDLQLLYENLRWESWREKIRDSNGDSVYAFFPLLWTKEGSDTNQVSRKRVPIAEYYASTLDLQNTIP